MPTVTETVEIAAPVDQVFAFIADDPTRATMFIPGLNRITNVAPAEAKPGQTWDYEFNWFGLVISGNSRCTKHERPSAFQFQTVTGNPSTWTYRLESRGSGTRLTFEVDFEMPENQLARFATAGMLQKMNESRAREVVGNLKALLES